MRDIKFKAWDAVDKCWYEPIYEAYKGNLYELLLDFNGRLVLNTGKSTMTDESRFPDRFKVMQYTGLKDKNGGEIYEGDVVLESYHIKRKDTGEERVDIMNYKVYWGHQEADYEQSYFYGWMKESLKGGSRGGLRDGKDVGYDNPYWDCLELKYEVIGNIHENPELLNKEKKEGE